MSFVSDVIFCCLELGIRYLHRDCLHLCYPYCRYICCYTYYSYYYSY